MAVLTRAPRSGPHRWIVRSVAVRARDGPQRLAQVYRLLLTDAAAATADRQPNALGPRHKESSDVPRLPAVPPAAGRVA